MTSVVRKIYVISDLHLGGRDPDPAKGERGFRMMRRQEHLATFVRALAAKHSTEARIELVINGDFIDFLAEQLEDEVTWVPFRSIPGDALLIFEQVARRPRDRDVLNALGELLGKGHDLTVILGNHDLELALPEVRAHFEEIVGANRQHGRLTWILGGEAYLVGDALIEHGNRYDPANLVDQDGLRELCALRSRWMFTDERRNAFESPPGSQFVAEIMNPLKRSLPFIDLLKPESEPLYAFVLALYPSARNRILKLIAFLKRKSKNTYEGAATPTDRRKVVGGADDPRDDEHDSADLQDDERDSVEAMLDSLAVTGEERTRLRDVICEETEIDERVPIAIGSETGDARTALAHLIVSGEFRSYKSRLALARRAMKILGGDQTFSRDHETNTQILAAAETLTTMRTAEELGTMPEGAGELRYIVFGHTHHAKKINLSTNAIYLNTGTWAELMRFPAAALSEDDATARAALETFATQLDNDEIDKLTIFAPTYVRLDVNDQRRVVRGDLYDYDWHTGRLTDPE